MFASSERAVAKFRTLSGLRFTVDASDIFAATVAAGHLREARDFEAFMRLVRPGSVVIDVGANFGLYAVSAAVYARPLGQVYAFEPAPGAFAMLERNIAENGLDVTAIAAAIGAARARAKFHVAQDVSFSSLHETNRSREAEPIEVEVATLDAALCEVKSIDLLKIDVEGGEAAVLTGARDVLGRSRGAIVQFEYSHKNLSSERHRELQQAIVSLQPLGLRVYRRGADGASELPSYDEPFSGNLFLAREGESERRLLDALTKTNVSRAPDANLAALALLRRYAGQRQTLQEADALERKIAEIAGSVVGDAAPEAAADAMRAVQLAWIEARKRAADAENAARSLTASLEGRDRLIEQGSEKVAALRDTIVALELRNETAERERDGLVEKNAQLRAAYELARQQVVAQSDMRKGAEAASVGRLAALRVANEALLVRNTQLQAALKASNEKLASRRQVDVELRQTLETEMKKRREGQAASQERLASVRGTNEALLERNAQLQAALKASNEKLSSRRQGEAELRLVLEKAIEQRKAGEAKLAILRSTDAEVRARLSDMMTQYKAMQHELARVRNVAKRMVERYDALRAEVGAGTAPEGERQVDERAPT